MVHEDKYRNIQIEPVQSYPTITAQTEWEFPAMSENEYKEIYKDTRKKLLRTNPQLPQSQINRLAKKKADREKEIYENTPQLSISFGTSNSN